MLTARSPLSPAPLLEDPSPSPCFLSSPKVTPSISHHSQCHRLLCVWRASLLSRLVSVLSPTGRFTQTCSALSRTHFSPCLPDPLALRGGTSPPHRTWPSSGSCQAWGVTPFTGTPGCGEWGTGGTVAPLQPSYPSSPCVPTCPPGKVSLLLSVATPKAPGGWGPGATAQLTLARGAGASTLLPGANTGAIFRSPPRRS